MTYPPAPSPWEGVTTDQPLHGFRVVLFTPPWGGPAEA